MRHLLSALLVLASARALPLAPRGPLPFVPGLAHAQEIDARHYANLRYRFIGPEGNRTIAVVGEPGNPLSIYLGAASGGLWRTRDGGVNWTPVFDDESASSVSALAMAPSDPNVIWAGTGETFVIRPAHAMGDGIYRSTDGGDGWEKKGLEATGRIGRIEIDPRDPDVVFACALGHAYGPQPERGVYRTTDGGESWERVLHVSEDAGCIDLALDHNNPRILFAAFWDVQIDTWGLDSGGPDSGVWRSKDGGSSWERLSGAGRGLPAPSSATIGKVAVEVAPSNSDKVYVLTEESSPGFYSSSDGGDSWQLVLRNQTINERAPYYTRFGVDPEDEDRIYFASVRFSMSVDGGRSLVDNPPRGGGDTHDVWIDPVNNQRIMVADDGGLTISMNRGRPTAVPVRSPSGCGTGSAAARAASASPIRPTATSSGPAATMGAGALQPPHQAGALGARVAGSGIRLGPGRPQVPLALDLPAPHLTPRPQHRIRGQPARSPHHRRGPLVGGDFAGPYHQRQNPPTELRRRRDRQPDDVRRVDTLRDRRVACPARLDLGGQQRRTGAPDDRQRRELGRPHREHS